MVTVPYESSMFTQKIGSDSNLARACCRQGLCIGAAQHVKNRKNYGCGQLYLGKILVRRMSRPLYSNHTKLSDASEFIGATLLHTAETGWTL